MKTPDRIWLVNMGDEVVWHDDPKPTGYEEAQDSVEYVRVGSQPSAEPVAWMSWDGDVMDAVTKSAAMRTVGMSSSIAAKYDEPLYLHPPTDSAALRDAAIAELVRRKMTSGNSVPVERCIITAAEIAAIAQPEAP